MSKTAPDQQFSNFTRAGRLKASFRKSAHVRLHALGDGLISLLRRSIEIACGLLMLALTILLLPLAALVSGPHKTLRLDREVAGRWGYRFRIYRLGLPKWPIIRALSGLPIGLNLVRGDLALVGPRPLELSEIRNIPPAAFRRFDVRPGVAGLFLLRKQANVAFDSEFSTDAEYIETSSLGADAGVLARYMTTAWLGKTEAADAPGLIHVLGLTIDNLTMSEASDWIVKAAEGSEQKRACFVNADCGNITFSSRDYLEAVSRAHLVLADGIGMRLASKMLHQPVVENVNGTDMFPRICERLSSSTAGLYLLGGKPGVAEEVAAWVAKNYPQVTISGYRDGYFKPEEESAVIDEIRNSGAGLLLVAFGAPRQDLWIDAHLAGVGVAVGVGGLFDFYSQRISRAPQWMRELGIEWMYRLYQEPRRLWKRYVVGNFMFLARVTRYRESHPYIK